MCHACRLTLILLVQIGVDVMVMKCRMLEDYIKALLTPQGMLFPFPLHFPKLDSCMMTSAQLQEKFSCDGSLKATVPSNSVFWQQEVLYCHCNVMLSSLHPTYCSGVL